MIRGHSTPDRTRYQITVINIAHQNTHVYSSTSMALIQKQISIRYMKVGRCGDVGEGYYITTPSRPTVSIKITPTHNGLWSGG